MSEHPSPEALRETLAAAGSAHHDYEQDYLKGRRDEQWAGWYAAYLLGRLGNFVSPSSLTRWLESAPSEGEWSESAAEHVRQQLET